MTIAQTERFFASPGSSAAVRILEQNGIVAFEHFLPHADCRTICEDSRNWDLRRSTYSDHQSFAHNLQWTGAQSVYRSLRSRELRQFLVNLFGDDFVCNGISFSSIRVGYPGMALHCDGKPIMSSIFGAVATSPVAVRLLVYLDGTSEERSPLLFLPGSHLSLHAAANPYRRYSHHAEEHSLTCETGTAVVIHQRLFHRAGAHRSGPVRSLLSFGLRPTWAVPLEPMQEPTASESARVPPDMRDILCAPNRGPDYREDTNWSVGLREAGSGLSPNRWAWPASS